MSKRTLKNEIYQHLLNDYHRHITILGYSENGKQIKYSNLHEFLTWLEANDIRSIDQVEPHMIKKYMEYLKHRPHKKQEGVLSLKTILHHLQSLRRFFALLQESGTLITNPMSTLKFSYPKEKRNERTVLTIEEIHALYRTCENLQERTILALGYGCGLRSMELVSVQLDDIKLDDGILIVPKGKGNKRRVVPMSPGVRADLKNYIENERDLYVKDEKQKALILNIKGEPMRKYTCRKILKKIILRTQDQAIIEKDISIHNLRHSIATHLLEKGVPVEQVRNFLGHAHLETTEIYTRVNQQQLKELLS